MMTRVRFVRYGRAALTLAVLVTVACAKSEPKQDTVVRAAAATCEDPSVVDTHLLAYLSAARARHHEANVREDEGDLPSAIAALERLVTMPTPAAAPGTPPAPELDEVLADARARLAELRVHAHDVEGAARDVRDGLAHATEPTYFRGHLLEVSGVVDEARAAAYADAGKRDEARAARARAVMSFQEAVAVQENVIGKTLDGRERDGGAK